MKAIRLALILTLIMNILISLPALAQNGPESIMNNLRQAGGAAQFDTSKDTVGDYTDLVGQVISAFFAVVGIILMGLIIHAGYLWATARGNEEHVSKAKEEIKNVIIGLIILVGAYAIAYFVVDALSGFNSAL
jgi:cytochrome bd-type quinol oxidase subunit 2